MTTKSLQARRGREAPRHSPSRGAFGTILIAAGFAVAAPALMGLLWQPQQPVLPATVAGPSAAPRPALPGVPEVTRQDDTAANPAPEPAPLTATGSRAATPMPPRSMTPWRRVTVAPAGDQTARAEAADLVGPLVFPASMSSRGEPGGESDDWFGSPLPADTSPELATQNAPTLFDGAAGMRAPSPPLVAGWVRPAPRNISAEVICPAPGCPRQPPAAAPPPAPGGRDITAALFPAGVPRAAAPAPVQAPAQGRDITWSLFPAGVARW